MRLGKAIAAAIAAHAAIADAHQTARKIVTGTYTGDGGAARQITVGFKCSLVIVAGVAAPIPRLVMVPNLSIFDSNAAHNSNNTANEYLHATDGFVVKTGWTNVNLAVYYYWAISE